MIDFETRGRMTGKAFEIYLCTKLKIRKIHVEN